MASKRFFLFSARNVQPHTADTLPDARDVMRHRDGVSDAAGDEWTNHSGQLAATGYFHADAAWGSVPLEIAPMDYAFGRYGPR